MTDLPLPLVARGKVRELYAVDDDHLLLVASDRLSAYDVVLPTAVPDKGAVLTGLSVWWFEQLADLVPGHLVTARVREMPAVLHPYEEQLRGRSMLCRRLDMVQVECVARGYLTGSGLADYRRTGGICGEPLVPGLEDGSRLTEPVSSATSCDFGSAGLNVPMPHRSRSEKAMRSTGTLARSFFQSRSRRYRQTGHRSPSI